MPYSACYWRSDFVAHQTKAGYMSVKMCSSRTVGTESGNGENLRGYWMPFGATFFLQEGTEYDGLTAVWDWSAIPGVTAPKEVPTFTGYLRHNAQFVGCIGNGFSSVAAMRLNTASTTAKKSWFLHGDTMIALGADIQSKHPLGVRTTVNQTHWRGLLNTDQGTASSAGTRSGLRWAWLNGILYRMLGETTAIARTEHVKSLTDLSNTALGYSNGAAASIFTLQIDHGLQPTNGSYAYSVTHGVLNPTKADLTPDVFTLISNVSTLQAVRWPDKLMWMAVVHSPTELQLDSKRRLRLNQPCLLIIGQKGDTYTLNVRMPGNATNALLIQLIENSVVKDSATLAPDPTETKQGSAGITVELKA
jgi:chondroitin AC lyase